MVATFPSAPLSSNIIIHTCHILLQALSVELEPFTSSILIYDKCYIICTDIREKIVPGVTHWQSPNYFAYYPSNSSTAGFLGEMLSAAFNIVGFSWITSPAATELEVIVLDWFAKMLRLPSQFLSTGKYSIKFEMFGRLNTKY